FGSGCANRLRLRLRLCHYQPICRALLDTDSSDDERQRQQDDSDADADRLRGQNGDFLLYLQLYELEGRAGCALTCVCDEVCAAIVTILSTKIRMPTTVDQLKASAAKFMAAGNGMPQCFAAVDGVHFAVKDWGVRAMVNRKGFTSYNVLALIDGDEQFINVEVGCPGSMHDARVMAESELADGLHGELGQLLWSARQEVNGCAMPMSILADSAYACHTFVLPAFKDTNAARCPHLTRFNTMHGPARRKIECTFGRLKARWRVLLRENDLTLPYVPTVIMACFILHNIAEQRAEPLPEADDRYMAMLAAYNAMFEGIELLGADEDGMGDNGGAAAAGGHLVPFGAFVTTHKVTGHNA
ncbi:hypothetical protein QJQ45_024594, partial [Haematococcus lacustris]